MRHGAPGYRGGTNRRKWHDVVGGAR